MKTPAIPTLWTSPHGFLHRDRLRREAGEKARRHALPISPDEVAERLQRTREILAGKLHLNRRTLAEDFQVHGEIPQAGYTIQRVSFLSALGIRVTGNLYIPEGAGPFPAVLNMHGHWSQGKIAAHVQSRGHILALNGIVTLTVDAAGSGERSEVEREWSYHGSMKAADLFLSGDTLMGLQVRDNQAALDVLQSLPFVNAEKIGATGASGGGNQTMWLAAMDHRVKVAVPVVSVGSFEVYVGACNCMCETLPDGLAIAEEWGVLGLIAPRPLLIMNALHDQPAFGYEAMSTTCRQVQEIYALKAARDRFDFRVLDMQHGYFSAPLHAMLGWMRHWLLDDPGQAGPLPDWNAIPEELLMCYPPGERPESVGYLATREVLHEPEAKTTDRTPEQARIELTRLVGWKAPPHMSPWVERRILANGSRVGALESSRALWVPTVISDGWTSARGEVRLILSPEGKNGLFSVREWAEAASARVFALAVDLPASGELAWDSREVADTRFHDSSRGCLWLGYTLVGEWAEVIASLCLTIRAQAPQSRIHVIAEKEAVFAALLCKALHPVVDFVLTEFDCPTSLRDEKNSSLVWCVPGFLQWGDLCDLRSLAASSEPASAEHA